LKVSIVKGGGIAGVVTRTELTTDALSPDDATELRDKVAASQVLEAAAPKSREAAHPDESQYEVTVDHDGGTHTARFGEADLPDSVRSLITWTEAHPAREEAIERG
jgi:emfourin